MKNLEERTTTTISYLLVDTQKEIWNEEYAGDSFNLEGKKAELLDKGYELLEEMLSPTFLSPTEKEHFVFVREKESVVFPMAPHAEGSPIAFSKHLKWPKGLESSDLNRTAKRTIVFQHSDGGLLAPTIVQEVRLGRSALVNHVRGTVTYMDWKVLSDSQYFEAVEVPVLEGYQADKERIPALSVDFSTDEHQVVVTYKGSQSRAVLRVIDAETNQEIFTEVSNGRVGELIQYPILHLLKKFVAQGYEIISNDFIEEHRFSTNEEQIYTIQVKPRVLTFQSVEELPTVGDRVYPEIEDSILWPQGLEKEAVYREIKREILFKQEDGSLLKEAEVQKIVFQRSVTVYLVTGEITYGAWEADSHTIPAFPAPAFEGYRAKPYYLPEWNNITPTSTSKKEVIVYSKNLQKSEVQFVDVSRDSALLYKTVLVGRSGDELGYDPTAKLQEFFQNGYELVTSDFPTHASFGYQSDKRTVYTLQLQPRIVQISSSSPKQAGALVEETLYSPKWPAGVASSDLQRTIVRTVRYLAEDDANVMPERTDHVLFVRDATVNLVTGHVDYSDWYSDYTVFPEVYVPEVEGYSNHQRLVPKTEGIQPTSSDLDYIVRYTTLKKPNWLRVYHAETAQLISERMTYSQTKEDLQAELDVLVAPVLEKGYEIASDYVYDVENAHQVTVRLRPVIKTLTATQAKKANSTVEGYSRLVWPKGVELANLQKSLTRTIQLCDDAGLELAPSIVQEVVMTRTAQVSLPTGRVSYSEWVSQTEDFPAIEAPFIKGYKPLREGVDQQFVDGTLSSQLVTLVYQPNPQEIRVYYRNSLNGSQVFVDEIVGKIGERIHYEPQKRLVSNGLIGYDIVESDCSSTLVVTEEVQEFTVSLVERTVTVTWEEAKEAYSLLELGEGEIFVWPKGLDKASLSYKVTREIRYVYEDQTEASDVVLQECLVYREAVVNLVTSAVEYSKWHTDKNYFDAVDSPTLAGYEVDKEQVPSINFKINGEAQRIRHVVTYYDAPYRFEVNVTDVHEQKLLENDHFVVRAGERLGYSLDNLIAHYTKQGYELVEVIAPEEFQLEDSEQNRVDIHLRPQFITVTLEDIQNNFKQITQENALQTLKTIPGLSAYDVSCQLKRTLQYVFDNGEAVAPDVESFVEFERQATVNLVTGAVEYSDWYSFYPIFDEVLSPIVEGYQASQEIVPAHMNVTVDMGDSVERVRYTPRIQEVVVNVINKATGDILYTETIQERTAPQHVFASEEVLGKFIHESLHQAKRSQGKQIPPSYPVTEKKDTIVQTESAPQEPVSEEVNEAEENKLLLKMKERVRSLLNDD